MKFAWIHKHIENKSIENLARNATEYITVELISRNIEVLYCDSLDTALSLGAEIFATIGTIFNQGLYDCNIRPLNVNESEYVLLDITDENQIGFLNKMLSPFRHFVGNTEVFNELYTSTLEKTYDVCVCSAGGTTPLQVLNNINLSHESTILVVDYSLAALHMSKKIIEEWDEIEDLNTFINKHKLTDDPTVYLGEHMNDVVLKKHTHYVFQHLDLFDISQVEECLKSLNGSTGIWLVSNIFNYITSAILYDTKLRHRKQQTFIEVLNNDKIKWDISLIPAAGTAIFSSSEDLLSLTIYDKLKILPWI